MSECMTQEDAMKMSNERAIYILKDYSNFMLDRNGCPTSEMYFAVQKAIKSLEKTTQEWIPVSERLPKTKEDGSWFFVTKVENIIYTNFTETEVVVTYFDEYRQRFPCSGIVKAWMPIIFPEAFKGGDAE